MLKFIIIFFLVISFQLGFAGGKPVNVNEADATTLADSLVGIGAKKAEAIIDYREANGPFKTADELTNVKGIGTKTVEKNREYIIVEEVAESAESMEEDIESAE